MKALFNLFRFISVVTVSLTLMFGSISTSMLLLGQSQVYAADTSSNGQTTTNVTSRTRRYTDSDYVKAHKKGNIMDWVLLVVSSILAARLAVNCKVTADVLAGSIAGGIEIAGEIYEFAMNTEGLKEQSAEYTEGNVTDAQREALIKIRDSYMDMVETLEAKQTFQYAAAAAYTAAALTAGAAYLSYQMTETTGCAEAVADGLTADAAVCQGYSDICAAPPYAQCALAASCWSTYGACFGALPSSITSEITFTESEAGTPVASMGDLTKKVSVVDTVSAVSGASCSAPYPQAATQAAAQSCVAELNALIQTVYTACSPTFYIGYDKHEKSLLAPKSKVAYEYFGHKYERQMLKQLELAGVDAIGMRDNLIKPRPQRIQGIDDYISYNERLAFLNDNALHSTTLNSYNALEKFEQLLGPKSIKSGLFSSLVQQGINLVVPSAEALDYFKLLGIVGPMLAVYYAEKITLGTFMDEWIASPGKRTVMWGVLAANTYRTASTIDSQISELEGNIEKIQNILSALDQHMNENPLRQGKNPNNNHLGGKTDDKGVVSRPVFEDAICIVKDDKKKNACGSVKDAMNRENSRLKGVMNGADNQEYSQARALASMAMDALQHDMQDGKLSKGTLQKLGDLGKHAGNLQKQLKAQQDKINKFRKSHGKKPLDYDSMHGKMLNGMRAALMKPLKDKGVSPKQLASSLFSGKRFAGDGQKSTNKDKGKKQVSTEKVVKMDGKKAKDSKKKPKLVGLDQLKDDELEKVDESSAEVNSADELAKLDYQVGDIVKDKDVSIFKVLTSRYFNSAYPKFFKKKKKK